MRGERERDHQVLNGEWRGLPALVASAEPRPSRAGALTGHGGRRRATGPASLSMWLPAVTRSPAPP
jgi:hypothetical protein